MSEKYYKIGRDSFGIMQYKRAQSTAPVRRLSTPAVSKMPEQLERWGRIEREKRMRKEQANYERQRPMVSNNTQLYETCLTFLEAAVERKDEERARYWSRTAFGYCPLPCSQNYESLRSKWSGWWTE
jgi:hypothetical protein